jgi:HK97 family phage prohead protease
MATKSIQFRVKAGPEDGLQEGEFEAYASVFDNVDSYGDVVRKGAFAKSLSEWEDSGFPIPLLFGHNMSDPDFNLGTVTAKEDDHGLRVKGSLDLESPKAKQTYRMLKGKRINQMSFAYDEVDAGPIDDPKLGEVRELRELKLYEVSIVPLGANQETEILAVKTGAEALVDGLKAGRVISAKNESELRKAYDAIGVVLSALESDDGKAMPDGPANAEEHPEGANAEEPSPGAAEQFETDLFEADLFLTQ